MSKKGLGFMLALSVVFLLPFISSQSDENQTQLDKAYQCIQDKVGDECSKLNVDEQIAVLLSKGDYKDCKDSLNAISTIDNDRQCWPKDNCKVKTTAMALLAFDRINADTSKIKNWLLNQTKIASDLLWYIQIESSSATTCKITYDAKTYPVNILENKKITSGAGACLSVSESGYWLRISSSSSPNCLEKSYTIECDKDFHTTLLYKSQSSPTIHVSQIVNSGVAGGETTENVIYRCFKTASACDYEGSLWASVALNKVNVDVDSYLPYLSAFMDDNLILFPETFLYIVSNSDNYLTMVLNNNFKGDYWNIGNYGKFYSTALALMALQGQENQEITSAKDYLLNGKTQNTEGCWENVRNTGLLLYAGWPSTSSQRGDGGSGGDECTEATEDDDCNNDEKCENNICVPTGSNTDCESNSKFCVPTSECSQVDLVEYLNCDFLSDVCCSVDVQEKTCSTQNGYLCNSNQVCPSSGTIMSASDSDFGCCSVQCQERQEPEEVTCINEGKSCKVSCSPDTEEQTDSFTCNNNQVCCVVKETPSPSYWWIWLLLILIIIVIVAIIFREKLKLLIFKFKNKFRKGPAPKETRPSGGFPPSGARQMSARPIRPMFPIPRPMPSPQRPVSKSSKDQEFEETLKKLKEMSK